VTVLETRYHQLSQASLELSGEAINRINAITRHFGPVPRVFLSAVRSRNWKCRDHWLLDTYFSLTHAFKSLKRHLKKIGSNSIGGGISPRLRIFQTVFL
tara:strand:- start:124 stop:420 length:297 start_codon:yes stop_codon:yes gene_type:complete